MATESRTRTDATLPMRVALRIRQSFLLSFATAGLLLVVVSSVFPYFADPAVAGILAASGVVVFVINVVGFVLYKQLERMF
jgi:membrane protein YdbS with pleckstrin-like domain